MKAIMLVVFCLVFVIVGFNWLQDNRAGQCLNMDVANVCAPTTTRTDR